jgi:DNA-binding beta-propeller fold protein YncE
LTIDDELDHARVFVSNVLNGTVTRLDLAITTSTVTVKAETVIASRYTSQENDAALILGPTGLAYDPEADVLFVASTADNMIFAVPNAGTRTGSSGRGAIIFKDDHLRGPLALVFAPNGDLLTANGDAVNDDPTQPSEIVEFTRTGRFVRQFNIDAAEGGAFGIGVANVGDLVRFAFVDDNAVDLTVTDRKLPAQPDD